MGEKGEFHWQSILWLENWDQHYFPLFSPGLVLFSLLCKPILCQFFVFPLCSSSTFLTTLFLPTGDELLGMDGARYLKLDDFKDQDDDFLSPKKTLRDFEGGMGTTWVLILFSVFLIWQNNTQLYSYYTLFSLPLLQAIFSCYSQDPVCLPRDCTIGSGRLNTWCWKDVWHFVSNFFFIQLMTDIDLNLQC